MFDIRKIAGGVRANCSSRFSRILDIGWGVFDDLRYRRHKDSLKAVNAVELRVIAPRRSGHHAVMNWLIDQCSGRYIFLNNCETPGNPYCKCVRDQSFVGTRFYRLHRPSLEREISGKRSNKDLLVYNYEDCHLNDVANREFEIHHNAWLGSSQLYRDVLILRDPFNLFASKFRWYRGNTLAPSKDDLMATRLLWLEYAREAVGVTSLLNNLLVISYNDWFTSDSYRDKLRAELGMYGNDRSIKQVARFGPTTWGDTFDGMKFDGKADQMKVLERWKVFAEDQEFLDLLADRQLLDLSRQLFPEMPGDDMFLQRLLNACPSGS